MKKVNVKKGIVIGIIILAIIIIIGIISVLVNSVNKKEAENKDNSYKNSYQYKMQREKSLEVLKGFYGDYIVTEVSGTSPSIQLSADDLKTLENNLIGSKITLQEGNFAIKYNDTKTVNLVNFSNVNVDKPYYEVNSTDETMFENIYKTSLKSVGITSNTPYFVNIGGNNGYEQEIIQNGNGGLLIYSQGVFFKLEPAAKILAQQNAQLEKLANDALKIATGNEYKYVFPVKQILKDGKLIYENTNTGELFMCKEKDNTLVPDKDTMFITLTKGVVTPVDTTKDKTDANNKDKNNATTDNKDKNNTTDNKEADKNAGKPFYNFTISTAGIMDQTQSGKPIEGKVFLDGSVEVGK